MSQQTLDPDTDHSRRPHRTPVKAIVAIVVVGIVALVGVQVLSSLPSFEQRTVDRSTEPLMVALEDISEYHAATGTFQVLVDVEKDTPWVPDAISGERTTLFATGHADALVDFSGLGPERITVSPDGDAVTITLPPPTVAAATLDPANSRIVDRDRGLAERIGGALADNPVQDEELYLLATQKLDEAARQSDLPARAEENTRQMLTALTSSLGFPQVTVTFADVR
ncbi:DUF4230 domain-containing protein [Pseudonocardia humida]|uniref:DUF4230 domain-containing protein n=1 Tax=Pseudonocardia humida TaxID=2800819 RepID=A0ABT1A503_9PSEU|nr:DUF4230 domain-containing protein [Pseudonocardia humida]MCO1658096.1 DUF4230 domain-containing protein [Pseudonocardia humida]